MNQAEAEAGIRRAIRRLFQNEAADIEIKMVKTGQNQRLTVEWHLEGWHGLLTLDRNGPQELSSKELRGVLAYLGEK